MRRSVPPHRRLALLAATIAFAASAAATPARADDDVEAQIGRQTYAQLMKKGEILGSSPLYAELNPIARRIAAVADPQYAYPFRFYLVHEASPNAFAVPGGNVYVTDSLMRFVKTREELAGVLCHETSHDIHHDVVNNARKDQTLAIGASLLSMVIDGGKSQLANQMLGIATNVQSLTYSRDVERAADLKGAYTCAAAGYNPWGMVRLFRAYEKADTNGRMEMLSDHPTDRHRIADLEREFRAHPEVFGRFSPSALTPLGTARTRQSP